MTDTENKMAEIWTAEREALIAAKQEGWKRNHAPLANDPSMKAYVEKVMAEIRKYEPA